MKKYFVAAGVLIFIAVFADFLTPFDPYVQDLEGALTPPNSINLLGTDRYGRDVLSRVIVGSQTTLCASLLLLATISIVGSLIGAICGFHGGRLDTFLMRTSDIFLAFPQMVRRRASERGGGISDNRLAQVRKNFTRLSLINSFNAVLRRGENVRLQFDRNFIRARLPEHCWTNLSHGGTGHWDNHNGVSRIIIFRAGRNAANRRMGRNDE